MNITWDIIDNYSADDGTHDISLFADGIWTAQAHIRLQENVPFLVTFDVKPYHYGHGVVAAFYKALSGVESMPVLIDESLATATDTQTASEVLIQQFDDSPDTYYNDYLWNWDEGFEPNLLFLAKTDPVIAEQIELMKFYRAVLKAENPSIF